MTATNPLLRSDYFPAFSEITPDHVVPAIETILRDNRAQISALLQTPTPGIASLGIPMEELGDRLNNAWSVVSHLNAVTNSDALREAYKIALAQVTEYSTELGQNEHLCNAYQRWAAASTFAEAPEAWRKAVSNAVRDFHLSGVDLPPTQKARYAALTAQLSTLGNRFSDNVLDATQAWTKQIASADELPGLPDSALALARQTAQQRGLAGYLLTLDFPCYLPVMSYSNNRELRKEMYEAYSTRASDQGPNAGKFDNTGLIAEILAVRHELATLLGFANYAERSLATKMATSVAAVMQFLIELAEKSRPEALREFAELEAFAREQGGPEHLQAWDVPYYSEKLRHDRYQISPEILRPYFPAPRVVAGMFSIVQRVFGIDVAEVTDAPRWHDDVRCYVIRRDGEDIAWFYLDIYARQNKRGGAWMADGRVRMRHTNGHLQKPMAYLTCNFTPPVDGQPSLLTHDEVTTLFHEFGHGLHHMLTKIEVADVSGINGVAWDAVELPSQFLENWCWEADAIPLISGHYQTGEPLPQALLDKMLAAKNFQSAMQMMRQLEFALFDFRLHSEFDPATPVDPVALLNEVRAKVAVVKPPSWNRFPQAFSHIFAGGYAAGYYSYKWAEVLAADAFSRFEDEGIFNAETGRSFRECVLEMGGSRDPQDLFRAFRGRDPQVEALLRSNGIVSVSA